MLPANIRIIDAFAVDVVTVVVARGPGETDRLLRILVLLPSGGDAE